MDKKECLILIGISGSGKSTWTIDFLKKENEKLKKDLKEYQDMVFNSAMNRPHTAEAMLKLMSEGHMTIHPKKD